MLAARTAAGRTLVGLGGYLVGGGHCLRPGVSPRESGLGHAGSTRALQSPLNCWAVKPFQLFPEMRFVDSLWLSNKISGMRRSTRSPSLSGLPSSAGCSARWGGLTPDGCLRAFLQEVGRSSPGRRRAVGSLVMSCVSRGRKSLGRVLLLLSCNCCRNSPCRRHQQSPCASVLGTS